ncbi:PREDICTED: uncharacterized protein LOC102874776 [Elephantulus edwardii]|uniref:uncharacterized protein LOC102874776 n=1 Tax=Elephantulus edwardii TaxID=28737 RepID=UPI0003F0B959|nr:PREDICTED: uncharacterized protein LOC102874776 [Elephantulus edwardii]
MDKEGQAEPVSNRFTRKKQSEQRRGFGECKPSLLGGLNGTYLRDVSQICLADESTLKNPGLSWELYSLQYVEYGAKRAQHKTKPYPHSPVLFADGYHEKSPSSGVSMEAGMFHSFMVLIGGFEHPFFRCVNYNNQHPNAWYIWFLLLIFLVALLCGVVLFCLQCWLKRSRLIPPTRTMAVFAVGDLDCVYGTEAAVSPTTGIHLQMQNPELYTLPCFGTFDPPPPYEENLKTS